MGFDNVFKGKILVLVFILFVAFAILPHPVRSSEAKVESHEAVEAQAEHATAAEVGEHDAPATTAGEHQGEEAAHNGEHEGEHGAAEHAAEPWWRFTGWEAAYAALSSALFLIILRWLPLILEDKTGAGTK